MKKFLKLIIILILIVFVISAIYIFINKNNKETENEENMVVRKEVDPNISGANQDLIEDYISKIYLGTGLVDSKDVLPEFDDINQASTDWILNCIHLELSKYSDINVFSEEELNAVKKDLFSEKLTIDLPEEDTYENIVKNEDGQYVLSYRDYEPDYLNYYIVDSIKEIDNNQVEVNLVEYRTNFIIGEETEIKVYNLKSDKVLVTQEITDMGEEGYSESDRNITTFVANNKEKFSKVKIILEKEKDNYYVKSIER